MAATRSTGTIAFHSICLLIVRLSLAALLLGRAWWRWAIEGMDRQVDALVAAGIPQPSVVAWGVFGLESVGAVLLTVGLLTRLVGGLVVVENVLIIALIRWSAGPYSSVGGFEHNLALAALGLVFVAFGSSYTGLDALLFRRRNTDDYSRPAVNEYHPA